MSINQHIEQQTEQFLRGELSGGELHAFENQMASNPDIHQYVDLQKQIHQGISHYRHTQLKARLDAIQVSPGWFGSGILGEGILKIAGATIAATIIGGAVFFAWPDNQESDASINLLDVTVESSIQIADFEILDMPIPQVAGVNELPSQGNADLLAEHSDNKPKESSVQISKATDTNPKTENVVSDTKVNFVPKVNVPSLTDVSDDKEFISQEISIPEVSDNDIVDEADKKPIDIKTFNRASDEIRYKYFDGKLFLYGDFKKEPYEILEINSKSARQIYLYYTDKYYHVEVTDEVKTLRPILGDKLINELKIIRNNKLN